MTKRHSKKDAAPVVEWVRGGGLANNRVAHGDGFAVSYVGNTALLGSFFAGDGAAETALVKGDKYYILNGDWRDEYAALIPQGFDACLAFYEGKRAAHDSSWTTPEDEEEAA